MLLPSRSFDADELWQVVARDRVTDVTIVGDAFALPLVSDGLSLGAEDFQGERFDCNI